MKKMKTKILITFFTLLFFWTVKSQTKVYYNEIWEVTTEENAKYYRVISKISDSLFQIKDHYLNGILQMDGYFSDLENEVLEGTINYYNENGKIIRTENYLNGILNGLTTVYLNNGKIDNTTEYKNGAIYNGVYRGVVEDRYYKNGEIIKDIEHNPPNKYYILKTILYGKEIDTIYWRTNKNKNIGFGTYKNNKIINGLHVLNLLDNTIFTYYKNKKREGIQKVYDNKGLLVAKMTYKDDFLTLDETLNPLTNKMVRCTYKDNTPFNGQYFVFKPMYDYYEEYVFKNGIQKEYNRYAKNEKGKLIKTK